LVMLGDLTGLLWFIATYELWIRLSPTVLGSVADWVVWAVSFLVTIFPPALALARRRMRNADPVMLLSSLVFPVVSLIAFAQSYLLGATLLVGSGFLAAYMLVSRSEQLLGIKRRSGLRVVFGETSALLAIVALGGLISVLQWGENFLGQLISGSSLYPTDPWQGMLAVDLEVFYLSRPILPALLVILALTAIVSLFRGPIERITATLKHLWGKDTRPTNSREGDQIASVRGAAKWLPYAVLAGAVALSIGTTLYPYAVGKAVFGSDVWFYQQSLDYMNARVPDVLDIRSLVAAGTSFSDRMFFIVLLFLIMKGFGTNGTIIVTPVLLAVLLAISTFTLVKEGTGRPWLAAFASALSVVSAQTALGMSAGIYANWFGLSITNFMFALVVRAIRLRSRLAAVGSVAVSFFLLGSYNFLWAFAIVELLIVVFSSMVAFSAVTRREWKYDVGFSSGILLGSIALPFALLYVATLLLGFSSIDPGSVWVTGSTYLTTQATPAVLGSALRGLEVALDFAGTRIDLPFLTLLSIPGLLDYSRHQTRSFGRVVSSMVLVPFAITLISPGLFEAWRGLYIIPIYLTGTLGAESIIRRVNGTGSSWLKNPLSVGFVGAFAAYVFLSHLSYWFRALELLIYVQRP
jgi:hypothetical protein